MKRQEKTCAPVDVLQFEDHQTYLSAVLKARRESRAQLSLRQLARQAGFATPSRLSMILNGKRNLSQESAEKLAEALKLSGRRKRYFLALAKLSRSKSDSERHDIRVDLIRIKSAVDESLLDLRQYKFLAEWYYTVIYVMVGLNDFIDDPAWIASKLRRPVTELQIKQAMKDLEALGLIKQKEGRWVQAHQALNTEDDIRNAAAFMYHKTMNVFALNALELPLAEREFNALTVSIPRACLPEVKDRIRLFTRELNEYLSQFPQMAEVFQLNVQLFPLTQKIEDSQNA